MSKFSDQIKSYISDHALSQAEFASLCSISGSAVGRYIKDTATPRPNCKKKILRVIGGLPNPHVEAKVTEKKTSKYDKQIRFLADQLELIIGSHNKLSDGCEAAAGFVVGFIELSK